MAHSNSTGPRKGSRYHRLDDIPTDTFTPRTYQIQLLDSALKRNTLLCLGCSESKLFLALMLAKELASPTRLQRSQGGKRTFYLTDTDDDVEMLYQTLPHHTDLQVEFCYPHSLLEDDTQDEISGTQMSLQKWCRLVDSSSILVCSGHLFLTALCKNYIDLKEVNLLVFDNCHRAVEVENHPYKEIVNGIKSLPQKSDQPHILGVTASIAGTDCSDPLKLQQTISEMEEAMFSYAETSMLILSERFGCRPKESVVQCLDLELDDEQEVLKDTLEEMLEQNYYFFSDCRIAVDETVDNRDPRETPMQVLSQCLNILNVLGSWCTASISEYFVMQLEKIVKCEKNEIHKKFLRCVITTLRVLIKEFEKQFHPDYHVNELLEYTTPKVRELVKVLRKYKPEVDFIIVSNGDSFNDDEEFSDLSDEDDDSIMSDSDGEDNSGEPFNGSSKPMHIAVKRTADGGHERIMTFSEEEEKNLCGIVFVENRYIAFGLNKVIEEVCSWDENLCFVKSCHVTGQGLRSANGKPRVNRTYKRQEEALRKFRTQECNLVIATLELEEGIDIPKCNLVIRFDPPKDFRAYALSKGRARARDAAYVILLDDENFEGFNTSLKVFKGIEQVLLGENRSLQAIRSNIPGEDADNEYDSKDDDDSDASSDERDNLPPYCTMPHSLSSPHVTLQGAIALINRYCAKLPSDAFTHLTPQCRIEKLDGYAPSYIANLRLPINSPVKEELKGPAMRTKKLAKMAVALKMCEILHKKGELDENLVPVGKEMFLYEEEEEWVNEEDLAGQARPGTTKRKQYYIKKTTDALLQCRPKPGQPCFLYLINLKLTGPITDEQNTRGRVIYAPEDTVQTLGILLSKKIPLMPYFPVYTRSGEVTASIDLQQTDLICSEDEINRLLNFHHFVFSGVLHLEKDPMEFDCVNADCGYIIVPLNGKGCEELTIEWSFVDKVIDFIKVEKRAGFSKKSGDESFQFCLDDFQDAVVMPSYRNIDQPQHFYVAEIRHDLNPLSPFPSPELYKTFQDYYTTKYGLMITNTEQPLLDVDHTSARLNLLTPRYMNQKGVALPTSSAETKRARRENLQQKQILVPELCDVHVFPASLWRKTVCLPAILYRANYLLLADELRRKISRETGIGVEELPPGFRFSKLDFGFDTSPEKLMDAEVNCNKKISSNIKEESAERSPDPVLCCMEKDSSNNRMIKESLVNDTDKAKDESSTSSDSDSGIASSSSDNNIDITPSHKILIKSSEHLEHGSVNPSKKFQELCGHDNNVNLTQSWCLDHNNILYNVTPLGSSFPGTNQCNIISNTEAVELPSTSSAVPQQDSNGSTTTSTVINFSCTSAPAKVSPDNATVGATISIMAPPSIGVVSSCEPDKPFDSTDSEPLAAETLPRQAIHGDKTSVALSLPCSTTSSSTLLTSSAPLESPSAATSTWSMPITSTTFGEKGHSSDYPPLFVSASEVTNASTINKGCYLSPRVLTNFNSDAASNRANCQADLFITTDINGCELNKGLNDASPALLATETSPAIDHSHPNHCSCINHPCVHHSDAQIISADQKHIHAIYNNVSHNNAESSSNSAKTTSGKAKSHINGHVKQDIKYSVAQRTINEFCNQDKTESKGHAKAKCQLSSDGPAIIMNSLSQELSDLDIDLIVPQADTPDTFHSFEDSTRSGANTRKDNQHKKTTVRLSAPANSEWPKGQQTTTVDWPDVQQTGNSKRLNCQQFTLHEQRKPVHKGFDKISVDKGFDKIYVDKGFDKISVDKDETGSANVTTDNYNATAAAEDIHVIKFSFNTDEPGVKCKEAKESSPPDNKKESSPTDSKKECNPPDSKKELRNENTENRLTFDLTWVKSPLETQQRNTELEIGVWKSSEKRIYDKHQAADSHREKITSLDHSSYNEMTETNHSLCQPTFSCVTTGSLTSISLDEDRDPQTFVGPSPCLIMQALTMSNANDFFSLERLETIGDSFLKYAITVYLYCSYPGIHEGKLSYLRSKQVSNYNLYRLGRRKGLAECMVSTKFEPYENWLPPGYVINDERRRGPVPKVVIVTPGSKINNSLRNFYLDETADAAKRDEAILFNKELEWIQQSQEADQQEEVQEPNNDMTPYSLQCHHGLPDKSVADCVEALIGCYLTTCGRKAALIFMSWLGLRVLPKKKKLILDVSKIEEHEKSSVGKLSEQEFDELRCPPSPMFSNTPANVAKLNHLLQGFDSLEEKICYKFRDRSYLLQAFTHASYHYNTITDCYQRVEFLGDAILDYVITRHLYEDSQKYSPGILTDLRSALVNNNIFAALAVKWGFHKYFKAISPSLFQVIDKFVKRQKEKKEDDIDIDEEFRELSLEENEPEENTEEDDEEEEEVEMEIPKALGDIFESVAGAIYLDSGMSLDTVWRVYYRMMKPHIDKYLKSIPKSPVRELLETEPETAKFERPERTMNGKVRVTVNVVGKGVFSGVGRNYRIAKSAAAKKALRSIRTLNQNLMN
uniref:ribonuclease III n=1 Tax=Lymnaea stagnalis TaxID=6523 RepID=A0A7S6WXH0_LYMST|nr:hypothetical protein [Lymnaea stagnalis]